MYWLQSTLCVSADIMMNRCCHKMYCVVWLFYNIRNSVILRDSETNIYHIYMYMYITFNFHCPSLKCSDKADPLHPGHTHTTFQSVFHIYFTILLSKHTIICVSILPDLCKNVLHTFVDHLIQVCSQSQMSSSENRISFTAIIGALRV